MESEKLQDQADRREFEAERDRVLQDQMETVALDRATLGWMREVIARVLPADQQRKLDGEPTVGWTVSQFARAASKILPARSDVLTSRPCISRSDVSLLVAGDDSLVELPMQDLVERLIEAVRGGVKNMSIAGQAVAELGVFFQRQRSAGTVCEPPENDFVRRRVAALNGSR